MPEISSFYGIRVTMYYRDHQPPHFHAEYGDDEIVIVISNLTTYAGSLPRTAHRLVLQWAAKHQEELATLWSLAQAQQPLGKIAPLS
ncbi:DUF4160 domain-containing protein (plasmid) [Deinococcus sp. KNUC1210]|uniref:DUF4160 domain-containing protein n=1 Tax=Deinococcus sp. KNUC1210 TaxID=2917691 RepID=UPI001EF06B87|nr:DUF4160 domain-containing protein [Deinococcus sp. KNUC1210]ULH17450.1 DUF4160 domain-containing protein [Deinococcus sp. KNUC1210]